MPPQRSTAAIAELPPKGDSNTTSSLVRKRRLRAPQRLHQNMSRTDIWCALEDMNFIGGVACLMLDRHVRDYLLTVLRQR
jgi:hypothetical protein